jgi:hypothetical protein
MRLYDQRSSTPSFSGDGNKWKRPASFFPTSGVVSAEVPYGSNAGISRKQLPAIQDTDERTASPAIQIAKKSTESPAIQKASESTESPAIQNADESSESSTSQNAYKSTDESSFSGFQKHSNTGKKRPEINECTFRFDIEDEGLSIDSSSNLSANAPSKNQPPRSSQGCAGFESAKPFPLQTYNAPNDEEVSNQAMSSTFQFFGTENHSNVSRKTSAFGENRGFVPKEPSKIWEDDAAFRTPELTQTESSEDSQWLDFSGDDGAINPFRSKDSAAVPKQGMSTVYLFPTSKKSKDFRRISNSTSVKEPKANDGIGAYDKYSTMLSLGVSVADVTKAMHCDRVDPSAISLMLTAMWTRSPR